MQCQHFNCLLGPAEVSDSNTYYSCLPTARHFWVVHNSLLTQIHHLFKLLSFETKATSCLITDSYEPVSANRAGSVRRRQSTAGEQQGHRAQIQRGCKGSPQVFIKPLMSHDVRTIYLQEPRFLPSSKRGEMCKAVWNHQSRTPLHQGRPTREISSCKTNIP